MDQAVQRHRIAQAWQTLSGGAVQRGARTSRSASWTAAWTIRIPGLRRSAAMRPRASRSIAADSRPVIVARVYSDVDGGIDNTATDGMDYFGHGTIVAGVAAAVFTDPGYPGIVSAVSGVAPGAWIGSYEVAEDTHAGRLRPWDRSRRRGQDWHACGGVLECGPFKLHCYELRLMCLNQTLWVHLAIVGCRRNARRLDDNELNFCERRSLSAARRSSHASRAPDNFASRPRA